MTSPAPLIGLIGRKRSGKDAFAAALVEHRGYARVAFAAAAAIARSKGQPDAEVRSIFDAPRKTA